MVEKIFFDLIKQREDEIKSLRKKGRKVIGYLCSRFPVELAYAFDLIPVRVFVTVRTKALGLNLSGKECARTQS